MSYSSRKGRGRQFRRRGSSLALEQLEGRILLSAPIVGSLEDAPDPVHQGADLTLTARSVYDPDEDLNRVEFYRSIDDSLNPATDTVLGAAQVSQTDAHTWQWQGPADWPAGQWYYFVRARDDVGDWSAEKMTTGTVNAFPAVESLSGSPVPISPGDILTLTAHGVSDPDGRVVQVEFFHDTDPFDGLLDDRLDQFLGRDTDGADGWTWEGEVTWTLGDYFARAVDNDGAVSDYVIGHVDQRPFIAFLSNDPNPIVRDQLVTFRAEGVGDYDGTVQTVEFWRDVYDSGHYNPEQDQKLGEAVDQGGGVWTLTLYADWEPDVSPMYFTRAQDDEGFWSEPVWTVNQNPYVDSLEATPEVLPLEGQLTLEALGVTDADGYVQNVVFSVAEAPSWWPTESYSDAFPTQQYVDSIREDDWTWEQLTPTWTVTDMAQADFDRDGDTDLAVTVNVSANIGHDFVSVLLNDGNGVFRGTSLVEIKGWWFRQYNPSALVTGDFNGDTYPDIAVANSATDRISILMNDGTGHFDSATHIEVDFDTRPPGAGVVVMPDSITTNDFNGDGILDIAVSSSATSQMSLLFGDGTGDFTLDRVYSFATSRLGNPYPAPPTVRPEDIISANFDEGADFEEGEDYDIATVSQGGLMLMWNKGPLEIAGGPEPVYFEPGDVIGRATETGITGGEEQTVYYQYIYRTGLVFNSYNDRTDDYYHNWISDGDIDIYRTTLEEGGALSVDVFPIPYPDDPESWLDTFIYVYDSDGRVMADNEPLGDEDKMPTLQWTAQETGNYYVAVAGQDLTTDTDSYDPITGYWVVAKERPSGGSDGEYDVMIRSGAGYQPGKDTKIYDTLTWPPSTGDPGIHGNVYFNDTEADAEWDAGEDIWADQPGGVAGQYDDGVDTQIYDGGDDSWDTVTGDAGAQDDMYFYDSETNGVWDDHQDGGELRGEYIWVDMPSLEEDGTVIIPGTAGEYDHGLDVQVYSADTWHPVGGDIGIHGNVYFNDANESGFWDAGEDLWADQDGGSRGVYDDGIDTQVYDGGDFVWSTPDGFGSDPDVDPAIHGNVYFYDLYQDGDELGTWQPGEHLWAKDPATMGTTPAHPIGYGDSLTTANFLEEYHHIDPDHYDLDIAVANSQTDYVTVLYGDRYWNGEYEVYAGLYPLLAGEEDRTPAGWGDLDHPGNSYMVGSSPGSITAYNIDADQFRDRRYDEPDWDWAQGSVEHDPYYEPYVDIVTTNAGDGSLSILINQGNRSSDFGVHEWGFDGTDPNTGLDFQTYYMPPLNYLGTHGGAGLNYDVGDYGLGGPFDTPSAVLVGDFNGDGVQTFVVSEKYNVAVLGQAYPFHNSDPLDLDQYDDEVPHVGLNFGFESRYSVLPWDDPEREATYYAVAYDEDYTGGPYNPGPNPEYGGYSRTVSVDVTLNQLPQIWGLRDNREELTDPTDQLTLTAVGVQDVDGVVRSVEFYRDDGDGLFNPDDEELLGVDENGVDGWTWTGDLGDSGDLFWVRAIDDHGTAGKPVDAYVNQAPTIAAIYVDGHYNQASDTHIAGIEPVEDALGIRGDVLFDDANVNNRWDPGEDIWRDANGNGIYDEEMQIYDGGTGWDTLEGTAGDQGAALFRDSDGDGIFDFQEEVWLDNGDVTGYYDENDTQIYAGFDGIWQTQSGQAGTTGNVYTSGDDVWADASISLNGLYNAIQEEHVYEGVDGWLTGDAAEGIIGNLLFDDDGDGIWQPGEGVWAEQVELGDSLTLMAVDVRGGENSNGATVRKVEFYRDLNYNGIFDPQLDYFMGRGVNVGNQRGGPEDEWILDVAERNRNGYGGFTRDSAPDDPLVDWSPGSQKYFAVAQDSFDRWSAAAGGRNEVRNLPPVIEVLTDSPDPVTRGEALTLTAEGVDDPYGEVHSVAFYLDLNGDDQIDESDRLLGIDSSGLDGWSWTGLVDWSAGTRTYLARVTDNYGASTDSDPAYGVVNSRPVYGGLFQDDSLSFDVGTSPAAVASGDFDGDSNPDLAIARSVVGEVAVWSGRGDGTFDFLVSHGVGAAPGFVSTIDLDEDGALDVVVANSGESSLSVLWGGGDGTFTVSDPIPVGTNPVAVAIGYFDGDARLDLAVANAGSGDVMLLLGRPSRAFDPQDPVALAGSPSSLVADDFDGDGNLDLAVASSDGNVYVLLGRGYGRFRDPTSFAVGGALSSVASGQFDEDGYPDLAVANSTNGQQLSIWLSNGDGSFAAGPVYAVGTNPAEVITGHFDEDERPDLAVAVSDSVSVLLGSGSGQFTAPVTYAAGTSSVGVTTADFDTDDALDLAVVNQASNNATVVLGIGGLIDEGYDPVYQADTIVLQATNLRDPDGDDIVDVEFYRDSNGSGALEVGVDHQLDPDQVTGPGGNGYGTWQWSGPASDLLLPRPGQSRRLEPGRLRGRQG